ncbi:hypothetical protein COCON_G00066060 [Conger conger]|uniref:Deleted in lung and esophageal cancer protein 1 n=2 Tax=Conger conger TaxID=82655 RepID=A0A9Q1DSC9_CONCO|nr:hypothetical protein COCON_G00066060 [Conger conger]
MLEKHILEAKLQATAKEELAHNNLVQEVGEVYHQLGLPPVKSTFKWCVDNTLLRSNNLICPEDYITEQAPTIKVTRGKSPPGFANATISFSQHIKNLPQDDGYTVIPSPDRMVQDMLEQSEGTLTLPSTPECATSSRSNLSETGGQKGRPVWAGEPSKSVQDEESAGLQRLKQRNNFLRNPRFLPPQAQRGGKSLILPTKKVERVVNGRRVVVEERGPEEPVPVFLANPPIVVFTDYRLGHVYETKLELRNLTATSRHVRVIPPNTPHFSIGLGKFPGEGGTVAPGMSCQYTVRFVPDSMADFADFILVETQAPYPLIVPIEAQRPPPILSLPRVLDCGYCLVGGVKIVEFLCKNEGLSDGTFCIMPKKMWPASNLRSVVTGSFAEEPPFGISPSLFDLLPGQATMVEVAFFPRIPESCSQAFTIVCDNCQVKDIVIQGTGQLITLELVSVTDGEDRPALGEICDLTAEHFIRFGPANPLCHQKKKLVIRNNAHLELPFHWQIMQPNLRPLLAGEPLEPTQIEYRLDIDKAFDISPQIGSLSPHQDHEFLLSYCPQEMKEYHSVCHLVLRDIPHPPKEPTEKGESKHIEATKVNDVIVMEIEVKGSTELHRVLLEPYAIHFPGETFIGTAIRKRFKMWNNSKSQIHFQWDRLSDCHILEVEPPIGEIEMNECCDMELVLTGGQPGPFLTILQCHVQNHCQPVGLSVEASFKGPVLSIDVPRLDFGLMKLGDQARSTLSISNNSQLEASWVIEERPDCHEISKTQIIIEPHSGVLPPLASCCIAVLFRPVACQHFQTILELAVENGTGCHLAVEATVQSPSVCLLSCELVFSELYIGVPVKGTVTLFNQTLLPAHFSWGKLQGKQSSFCSACFSPSNGILGPNTKMEVEVEFTADTDMELTEVAGICEVKEMQDPLVLGFFSKAKGLHVSYSLPATDCPATGSQDPSDLVLDFGSNVLLMRAATKQLTITNHTAIPAPFHLQAEYFTGRPPSPPEERGAADPRPRTSYSRRQIHLVSAKKTEGKTQQDFANSLLAHGKGAAFFIQPASGTLGAFETHTVDITAFTNMWGDYTDHLICKVGNLEPVAILIKMSVRGCPVYFQMMGPQLETQTRGPIIRFGMHVSGGDTVSRSLRLNNCSPYNIRMDWETYNQEMGDKKLVDFVVCYGDAFPLKDVDGNEVLGGRRGSSESITPTWGWRHSPYFSEMSSSLSSDNCPGEEEEQEYEEEEVEPTPEIKKLISVHLRAHDGNASDYPYCITPQQILVPAGGSATVHVSFTPLTLSDPVNDPVCAGFALGFMSLDKVVSSVPGKVERVQGFELEPLRLDLQASVKQALLSVQMEEEEEALEFHAIASDLIQHKWREPSKEVVRESILTRSLQLKNTTEMRLSFRLHTQPPFSVLLPQYRADTGSTDRHAEECQSLILRPQHNLQVKVGFHNSLSLLTYQSLPEEQLPPNVQLVRSDSGERRLQFKESLVIEYNNNSVQMVPLCAHLSMPTLYLSETNLDFGTCYVGQTRVKEVFLCNQGGSCSYWTATLEAHEQSGQFTVTPVSGILEHSVAPYRQPVEISFTASEQGEAKATVTVQGILGESPVSLQIQGKGSFDERFTSLLDDA